MHCRRSGPQSFADQFVEDGKNGATERAVPGRGASREAQRGVSQQTGTGG